MGQIQPKAIQDLQLSLYVIKPLIQEINETAQNLINMIRAVRRSM